MPDLEIMQDIADDVILGVFINVPDVRGQIFDIVLLLGCGSIIDITTQLLILWERSKTVTTS